MMFKILVTVAAFGLVGGWLIFGVHLWTQCLQGHSFWFCNWLLGG